MEKISTAVHGQCWICDKLHVLVGPLACYAKGFEMMRGLWDDGRPTWMQDLTVKVEAD